MYNLYDLCDKCIRRCIIFAIFLRPLFHMHHMGSLIWTDLTPSIAKQSALKKPLRLQLDGVRSARIVIVAKCGSTSLCSSSQLVHRPQSAAIFVRRAPCSCAGKRRCSLLSSAAAAAAAASDGELPQPGSTLSPSASIGET